MPMTVPIYSVSSALKPSVWERELEADIDKDFLLDGIQRGFHIVDKGVTFKPAHTANYRSATGENHSKVEMQICQEILEGHYVITPHQPIITSALL